jgi:hypothetical protein
MFLTAVAQRPFFLDSENSPKTWLLLFEFSFTGHKYNSSTRAQQLIAFLPTEILQKLGSKVISIMSSDKSGCDFYAEICDLIKDFYKPSENALFDKYFKTQSLGSLRPTQFLNKVRSDLEQLQPGSSLNDNIIKRSFLSVLPATAQAILAGSEKSSLNDLAEIADKIILNLPSNQVSNVETSVLDLVKTLSEQVASLQLEVASQRRSRSPARSFTNDNSHSRSRSSKPLVCHDHFKLGNNASTCCIGCSWSDKKNCRILPLCIFHSVFSNHARRCLEGCQHQKN